MLREKVTNLFVLGVAIILVYIAKNNFKDYFVPVVSRTPIGNGMLPGPSQYAYPTGQPVQYKEQMWPVRVPYQPRVGTPCTKNEYNGRVECPGATGMCVDGVCQPKTFNRTVFGIEYR